MIETIQREFGAYFTPPNVSQYIVEWTISRYFLKRVEEEFGFNPKSVEQFMSNSEPTIIERAFVDILKPISVLDPAVGNGIFLLAAIDALAVIGYRLIEKIGPDLDTTDSLVIDSHDLAKKNAEQSIELLKKYFASYCIFGVDINPNSVEDTRSKIKQHILGKSNSEAIKNATDLLVNSNIVTGNSLIGFTGPFYDGTSNLLAGQRLFANLRKFSSQFRRDPTDKKRRNQFAIAQSQLKNWVDDYYRELICSKLGKDLRTDISPFHWFIHFPEIINSGGFDITIGNPPFLDSKRWNYAAETRASFELNYNIVKQAGNADMFAYFIEACIRLLKPEGAFGFIVSDKWLDVGFGLSLKQFLLDETHLHRIITIDQGVFRTAAVDCAIIFGHKKSLEQDKKQFNAKFIRIPKASSLHLAENANNFPEITQHTILTSLLSAKERWSTFLKAPKIYYDIISSSKLEPLSSIATVRRGITTGANQFFFLTEEVMKSYGIPKEFARPIISSPRLLKERIVKNAPSFILAIPKDVSLETLPNGVRHYITEGANRDYHKRQMVRVRKPWYSLPLSSPAPILAAKMMDKAPMFYLNPMRFLANNVFYEITPLEEFIQLVWLYLNSTVAHLLIELQGRSYHGGVLEIAAFELKKFPCLSATELPIFSKKFPKLSTFSDYFSREKKLAMDKAILATLGLENRYKELIDAVSNLQKYRLTKKRRN
ncbi:MAG: Eco57I restriction-modification methylase domain-containing protein [Candidatus Hodarchaeales archaeon]|jgi:hypothetical protein